MLSYVLLVFLSVYVGIAQSKCGIYFKFHQERQKRFVPSFGGYPPEADIGFESFSYTPFCNDMEMFEQCKKAQKQIDTFVSYIIKYLITNSIPIPIDFPQPPNLRCADSIVCYGKFTENRLKYCENMDSFDKCVSASFVLGDFMTLASNATQMSFDITPLVPEFECQSAKVNTDNIPIHQFRYIEFVTTEAPTTTMVPTTTAAPAQSHTTTSIVLEPTAPAEGWSTGAIVGIVLGIVGFILFLLVFAIVCIPCVCVRNNRIQDQNRDQDQNRISVEVLNLQEEDWIGESFVEEETDEDCTICSEKLLNHIVEIKMCHHKFHKACIIEWKQKAPDPATCPLCRTEL